jgi:8-oxo-dGTP pyrophosphatase MutT (NUDIX family)
MRRDADAAVAIVHARSHDSVLLVRRSERDDDPWSGHWSLPGGGCEARDESTLHTALRELAEETGIRLSRQALRSTLPLAYARSRTGPCIAVAPFVFDVETEMPVVLDPREAVEFCWIPVATLADPARHSIRPIPGMPPETPFPCIELASMPLWGFTYRLLSDWLGIAAPGSTST